MAKKRDARDHSRGRGISRRELLKATGALGAAYWLGPKLILGGKVYAQIPGGTLEPLSVTKYLTPMLIPPVMPKAGTIQQQMGKNVDYYEISMKQFDQQILPAGMPATTVWGYGAVSSASKKGLLLHNAPSLTIEAQYNRPVRVKWINDLVDADGDYLPHLLPVDPTLHWANVPQVPGLDGVPGPDKRPDFTGKTYVPLTEFVDPDTQYTQYTGPVPIVTHVHGAIGVGDESDGYTEAWYLPATASIPAGYAREGTWYEFFAGKAAASFGATWGSGYAIFQYPNLGRPSTDWYHDHALGMTRLNVYAGPAGFFIIRGGPDGDGSVLDTRTGLQAVLPGPAPKENDKFPPNKTYYEIPIAIQDRSFNSDGSLFYPDTREFFDGIVDPYIPDGPTPEQFSPIWQPEFFGNMMMINGNTWPFQVVEQRRYRFRFLNGCQSRFLILDFNALIDAGAEVWVIANEGGFLGTPVDLSTLAVPYQNRLLMGLAERADVIVDFTHVPLGDYVLGNVGPDEPFGGGVPVIVPPGENPETYLDDGEFAASDPDSTGQIMQFRVVPAVAPDPTTPPQFLQLPAIVPLPAATVTRPLALLEEAGIGFDGDGEEVEGPVEALLGTVAGDPNGAPGVWTKKLWMDPVTENPAIGATELWEIYNATGDAHPMHVHEVAFEVVGRQDIIVDEDTQEVQVVPGSVAIGPEPWETGFKDTVIAYPGQVTRIRAQFNTPGQFVWHCHIVEHEDNEMMRPYRIGPVQPGQPG